MSALTIPAATVRVTAEDVSLDLLCFRHLMAALRDRQVAGRITGYVEATLAANPRLAGAGTLLPFGLEVKLPEFSVASASSQSQRLWD